MGSCLTTIRVQQHPARSRSRHSKDFRSKGRWLLELASLCGQLQRRRRVREARRCPRPGFDTNRSWPESSRQRQDAPPGRAGAESRRDRRPNWRSMPQGRPGRRGHDSDADVRATPDPPNRRIENRMQSTGDPELPRARAMGGHFVERDGAAWRTWAGALLHDEQRGMLTSSSGHGEAWPQPDRQVPSLECVKCRFHLEGVSRGVCPCPLLVGLPGRLRVGRGTGQGRTLRACRGTALGLVRCHPVVPRTPRLDGRSDQR
jgi:hypothetical protein